MFIILLTYVAPLEDIDHLMGEHMAYLRKHYQAGDFLVSGRRVPRTGGVILAKGDEPESVAAIVEEDPFVREGAATYEIVQFNPSQTAPGLRPFFS